ncbi:ECF RNA polymerase sigma factor SigW [Planctopirus ephydatiae]|uniref:RNA polymerase sigma factor n=1 Tax=Planctopirus ephydatiae TaxID=2528019 RepID=A0A518GIU6_9PLAN|nr:sigma-70 family RNA polymerase sigma factor [Planctopirus ephydatiae]QDV28511.1 ECF RNA polymerase sigma factor SigW [Planctopirus ephydatiae]
MEGNRTYSESELIRRIQAGESGLFQELARRHSESLLRCAFTLCRDQQFSEDLAQEALLEGWRFIGRFDGRCQFSTWLYGILRHRFLKSLRRKSLQEPHSWLLDADPLMTAETIDPVHQLQLNEDASRLRQAVALLPDEHRQVIELRFFAEASLEDIAAVLDVPLGTVKSRLHNGLEKLRQQKITVNLFSNTRESGVKS